MNHIITPTQVYPASLLFHFTLSISSLPTPQPYPLPGQLTLCTLGFFFFACPVHPPTHPPFRPPLPTPVINFSTEPLSFFLVSSLLSLHFPLLFFPHHQFFRFSYISLRKKKGSVLLPLFTVASQKRGTGHAAVQRDGTICELTQNSQFLQFVVLHISKTTATKC